MGLCASCCGRRRSRRHNASETTPLLAKVSDPATIHSVSRKAVDVIAALKAGKYPSQDQLNHGLRVLLKSDVLKERRYGLKLSEPARRVMRDAREVAELALVFGLEKNDDDRLQDLLYHIHQIQPPTEAATTVLVDTSHAVKDDLPPSHEIERDVYEFAQSAKLILNLLFTSTAFRLFLSTLANIAQAAVTELASDIGDAAAQVRDVAEVVEHVAEGVGATALEVEAKVSGDVDTSVSNLNYVSAEVHGVVEDVINDADIRPAHPAPAVHPDHAAPLKAERNKADAALAEALQTTLYEARQRPAYAKAIRTIVGLLEKYLDVFVKQATKTLPQEGQTSTESITRPFMQALHDARVLVERLASGKSLSPALEAATEFLSSFTSSESTSEIRLYLAEVRAFLDRSLSVPGYISSEVGKRDTLQLLEQARVVFTSSRARNSALDKLSRELHAFSEALRKDRTTARMWTSFTTLLVDIEGYASSIRPHAARALHLSETLWTDATTFVWTAFVSVSEAVLRMNLSSGRGMIVPIPRVEYTDASAELALDGRLMRVSLGTVQPEREEEEEEEEEEELAATNWFTPSSVLVRRWNELHVDFAPPSGEASAAVRSSNKVQVHVEGLLAGEQTDVVSLDDLGYYVRYKMFPWYVDEGVVGLDVELAGGAKRAGEGSVDLIVDLEAATEAHTTAQLTVESVKVTLPPSLGLHVELVRSRHWILNALVTNPIVLPLGAWFVKRQVEGMLEGAIKGAVESVGVFARVVTVKAKEEKKSMWGALVDAAGAVLPEDNDESRMEANVTMRGVQVDMINDQDASADSDAHLAVGVVPQLLPAKGEPAPLEAPGEAFQRAVEEIHDTEERVVEQAHAVEGEVLAAAVQVKQGVDALQDELEDAPERIEREEEVLERTSGWRSDVYTF